MSKKDIHGHLMFLHICSYSENVKKKQTFVQAVSPGSSLL